ncbi:Y-box-binding protein 2 [Rhodotorula toruloides]|uniref:Y-box-binding protein 2 n=1 Tax=Rhodotorula toruloides TaxID=5286 RepID=A0A511KGZ4_RHOTO|nr:Y-box-binding protein 2 [Rhodotorula toruloides]
MARPPLVGLSSSPAVPSSSSSDRPDSTSSPSTRFARPPATHPAGTGRRPPLPNGFLSSPAFGGTPRGSTDAVDSRLRATSTSPPDDAANAGQPDEQGGGLAGSFEALVQALPTRTPSSRTGGDLDGDEGSRVDPHPLSSSPGAAAATPEDIEGEWDAQALRMSLGKGAVGDAADGALVGAEALARGEKRRTGRCKFFNAQKGFGFILDDAAEELGNDEVFVHYTTILAVQGGPRGFRSLMEGEIVEYSIVQGTPCIGSPPNSVAKTVQLPPSEPRRRPSQLGQATASRKASTAGQGLYTSSKGGRVDSGYWTSNTGTSRSSLTSPSSRSVQLAQQIAPSSFTTSPHPYQPVMLYPFGSPASTHPHLHAQPPMAFPYPSTALQIDGVGEAERSPPAHVLVSPSYYVAASPASVDGMQPLSPTHDPRYAPYHVGMAYSPGTAALPVAPGGEASSPTSAYYPISSSASPPRPALAYPPHLSGPPYSAALPHHHHPHPPHASAGYPISSVAHHPPVSLTTNGAFVHPYPAGMVVSPPHGSYADPPAWPAAQPYPPQQQAFAAVDGEYPISNHVADEGAQVVSGLTAGCAEVEAEPGPPSAMATKMGPLTPAQRAEAR